jgi:Fe2+ or Zn2+ uptake regulation protein
MALKSPQTADDLLSAIEDRGLRITGPRRELAWLVSHRSEAFSAEEINADTPRLGRATVYRTLKLLVEAGVLCKTVMPDGSPRYSLDDFHHHHHQLCVVCGRVEEFRHPAVERMVRAMRRDIDGELVGHRLELYTRCRDCTANRC